MTPVTICFVTPQNRNEKKIKQILFKPKNCAGNIYRQCFPRGQHCVSVIGITMCTVIAYLNAKYLHAIGQNRITWRWKILTVTGQQFTLAIVKSSNVFFCLKYFYLKVLFWFWGISKQIVAGIIDYHGNFSQNVVLCFQPRGNILRTSGKKFSVMISTPVTICMLSQKASHFFIVRIVAKYKAS